MAYNFSNFKDKVKEINNWLSGEFAGIRTGRATPAILDKIMVESYGSKMAISHVATVSTEDARSLRISPWDKSQIKEIEKAIASANLGVSASSDDAGVRVNFPELTSESRTALLKIAKQKLEDARISLRRERDEVWEDIQEKEKGGELSEDEKFRYKDELQRVVDEANKSLDEVYKRKEIEISGQ